MENKTKREKGITLIVLVVTIIVLIILSGVTIATLTGHNGIINKAQNAKDDTQYSQWEEQIDIAIIDAESKHRNPTMDEIIEELKNKHIIDNDSQVNEETGTITTNKPVYDIEGKLDDYLKGITADVIANAENKGEFYGAIVNGYTCENSEGVNAWKIFYADENNIYIIADDYIHEDYCPSSANYEIVATDNKYKLSMSNVINDYEGSQDITDEKIKELNNDYFNVKGYSSTNKNMKAVAYMLDTDVWSVFAGDKAEYAIGGPIVEMLIKSYDEKYNGELETEAINEKGYSLRNSSNSSWSNFIKKSNIIADSLYVIESKEKASAMWLSSPAAERTTYILSAEYSNDFFVYRGIYSTNYIGFRPLVCLKSNVELEKNDDRSYTIKE